MKADKKKRFTSFTKELDDFIMLSNAKTLNIKNRYAIFYCMKEVSATFKQIYEKVYDGSIVGKSDLLLSTDMYKENSIKSLLMTSVMIVVKNVVKNA